MDTNKKPQPLHEGYERRDGFQKPNHPTKATTPPSPPKPISPKKN